MIGDPTEGALVVLAEKGGLDLTLTRERYPARRRAAVRHGLQADGHVPPHDRRSGHDVIRCFVKGAPDQLLARARCTSTRRSAERRRPTRSRPATWRRTNGWPDRACA
jgi:magnesium-transporting ATPase (P-type)